MSNEEIKCECEFHYQQIRDSESRLKELRAICKHPNTFEGNYSWRIGSTVIATICSDCGELLSNPFKDTIIFKIEDHE